MTIKDLVRLECPKIWTKSKKQKIRDHIINDYYEINGNFYMMVAGGHIIMNRQQCLIQDIDELVDTLYDYKFGTYID